MRRWYQYQEASGTSAAYTQKVTLVCMMCLPYQPQGPVPVVPYMEPGRPWQYRTNCLSALIQHYRNEHAENFVSVQSLRAQTIAWHDEHIRRTQPGPYFSNVTYRPEGYYKFDFYGITV